MEKRLQEDRDQSEEKLLESVLYFGGHGNIREIFARNIREKYLRDNRIIEHT